MRTFTAFASDFRSRHRISTRRAAAAISVVLFSLAIAAPAASPAATLADKQAQAAKLGQQVEGLETKYGDLQERWRGALVELKEIRADVADSKEQLAIARRDLHTAKGRLQERAIAIYRDGGGASSLQLVAEAGSLEDFFARMETIERVSDQDASILERVRTAEQRVAKEKRRLDSANKRQTKVVHRADRAKKKMKTVLDERKAALDGVTAEIRTIMEAQRAAAAAADARRARANASVFESTGEAAGAPSGGDSTSTGDSSSSASSESTDSSSSSVSVPLPPASGSAASAASIAVGKSGSPYAYGAAGPSSFDCSGLVVWAFAQAGRPGLPHSTYSLIGMGVEVPMSQAQVGDLVFTNNAGHMGIYVGGGSFVHAPRTGRTVTVESLANYSVVSIRRI